MICKFNEDFTERLAQHDDYGHVGEKKQFYFHFSRQWRNWCHQSTPPFLGQHIRLIVKFKSTLDCNWSWRLTFIPFPFAGLLAPQLVLGICGAETDCCTNSIPPTLTILEIWTPRWPEDSPTTEDSTLATPNHLSGVSWASFRRTTTTSYAFFKSSTTATFPPGSMRFHGS